MSEQKIIPTHIGYILDGNRRWAKTHGLPVYEGHLAGYNSLKDVVEATADAGVEYISLYTWSTENWTRAEEEVKGMMGLVRRLFKSDIKQLIKDGYKLVVLGTKDQLPEDIIELIEETEAASINGTRATVALCFNYGGQVEIVDAVKKIVESGYKESEITRELIAKHLYAPTIPPCDLIVRTSGEQRLSNFMLWRSAYSEFLFLDKNWPEMGAEDVTMILEEYNQRERRIGG